MQESYTVRVSRIIDKERIFALAVGIFFLFIGIVGFIPGFISVPAVASDAPLNVPNLTFSDGYGNVLGLFPTNYLHNAVHIVVGVLGITAATSFSGSLVFNRGLAIVYAAIAIMGLLPFTNTTFGLMPIFGNNVWLNALTAAAAGYYGFFKSAELKNIGASSSV
ncbi:DUF4383 domain-containing protein [Microcoleus sp. FACHB-831]|uniref:DUF4383 domain-containing protein n=1 Tax=Microcoleus sp. FACHB-831 TaxID=2692827 RepID=UPI0016896948|nr:DUF4383 domain-containing protein [Microcoleus sp. FACHB-831]MBD1923646.1 DUF4383 domain-containing protein [Microcoleus sp. FACHB-831]